MEERHETNQTRQSLGGVRTREVRPSFRLQILFVRTKQLRGSRETGRQAGGRHAGQSATPGTSVPAALTHTHRGLFQEGGMPRLKGAPIQGRLGGSVG